MSPGENFTTFLGDKIFPQNCPPMNFLPPPPPVWYILCGQAGCFYGKGKRDNWHRQQHRHLRVNKLRTSVAYQAHLRIPRCVFRLRTWSHIKVSTFRVRSENKPAHPLSRICTFPSKRRAHMKAEHWHTKWEGHEATDTGFAYAPVSQAHGHYHSVQCFALLHCSTDQFCTTPGGF